MASISQRGESWRASVRRSGVSISRTFDSRDDAEQWAAAQEARIAEGAPAPAVAPPPSGLTVAALFERYARDVSPSKGGWRWERIRLLALGREFGTLLVTALDGPTMADWRDRRLRAVSAGTVNRELNLISAVLTRAIKEWRVPLVANPVHNIQRPRQPPNRTRRVSDEERAAIVRELGWSGESAPADTHEWIAWAFCLALETMMRQGEILGLTWQHVHLDRRFVHLPRTKNGHPRNVPLSAAAMALLRLLPEGRPDARLVPVAAGTFGRYFREAVRGACIADLHFHDSRREALTRLAPKFGDPLTLGAASGHRDYRSLRVYFEPDPGELAKKLDG